MPEASVYDLPNIIIDEELKNLLPTIPESTFNLLEESLLEHGCLHPLVLWGNVLIDGHNRYEIAKKHEIPFTAVTKDFSSRDEVIIWIITTQVSRRNLNAKQLSYYRGLHYKMEKRIVTNEKGSNQYNMAGDQNDHQPHGEKTARRLAKQYHVSEPTIRRDEKFADAIIAIGKNSPEAQRNILSGTADISRKHLQELMAGAQEDILDTAKKIEAGLFEKPRNIRSEPSGTYSSDNPDAEPNLITSLIINTTDYFIKALHKLTSINDTPELKTTLRTHIEVLESLYSQL